MDFNFKLARLTTKFYNDFPHSLYPEILHKDKRVYNCFVFELWDNKLICIPYRTEINHKYSYLFKHSDRAKLHNSGLDFTKTVIVTNSDYICTDSAVIDEDEFKETLNNIDLIAKRAMNFVKDYIDYINGMRNISKQEFIRRYKYSPLQYFHKELNI